MLQKQAIDISFAKGIDTKTDPWRVELGNFLALNNTVFTKAGLLQKRNGYGTLAALPDANSSYITTLNDNLTAIGSTLRAYSSGTSSWVDKGTLQPLTLSVLASTRSAINQVQCDTVVATNGLACTAFTEYDGTTYTYKYSIQDSTTGQSIVDPTAIPVSSGTVSGSPRVFLLGGYFIVVFTNTITATNHLQYIAVSTASPTTVVANTDIASSYDPANSLSWDGLVYENRLYIAYNTSSGGQAIKVTYIRPSLGAPVAATTYSTSIATMMSMCVDATTASNPIIYVSFYDSASNDGYAVAVDQNLNNRMSATQIISAENIYNLASTAQGGVLSFVYEVANSYLYDSAIVTNYLKGNTVTLPATVTTGTLGTASTVIRSLGLASKAFLMNDTMYFLGEFASLMQKTYFLLDFEGNIISRFAYENGGASLDPSVGYLPFGLPQAQVRDTVVNIAYLFKDLIESINTTPNSNGSGAPNLTNIYSQTGVNTVFYDFSADRLISAEIGGALNLSGGMLWSYDGKTVGEQGFHVFPENVELADPADPTPTGDVSNVTNPTIMTSVSSLTNIAVGMTISGLGIPANTIVLSINSGASEITMSQAATSAHTGATYTFTGSVSAQQYYYVALYEWMDANGNINRSAPSIPVTITTSAGHSYVQVYVPTLRLTYKTDVKISIYRWSAAQQIYYQVTSVTAPVLNDKTIDYILFVDLKSDSQIVGNEILYTTGGVLENTAGPASVSTTLFDNRLWSISAEDRNLVSFSKQIIEGVPVENSDLLTLYVAPSTGAQGSTGDLECLAPMDDKLVFFKKDAIYYISGVGQGPDNTGANNNYSSVIFVTSSVGCANQKSIVLTPGGLMFQSDKGIWRLGRDLSTTYIGAPVEAYNSYAVNSALVIPGTTQVRFTLSNGATLMYDYFYEQWSTFSGVGAISSTLFQGLHTYVSSAGIVSQETPGAYLDNGVPVLMSFTTSWINVAGLQGYMRSYFFYILGKYLSPHLLRVSIAYDYNASPTQSKTITPTNSSPYYGGDGTDVASPYGNESPYGGPGSVEWWRVFLARQRCSSFQITLEEFFDPSVGQPAGQGLTISGLNLVVGMKKGYRPQAAKATVGGGVNSGG